MSTMSTLGCRSRPLPQAIKLDSGSLASDDKQLPTRMGTQSGPSRLLLALLKTPIRSEQFGMLARSATRCELGSLCADLDDTRSHRHDSLRRSSLWHSPASPARTFKVGEFGDRAASLVLCAAGRRPQTCVARCFPAPPQEVSRALSWNPPLIISTPGRLVGLVADRARHGLAMSACASRRWRLAPYT